MKQLSFIFLMFIGSIIVGTLCVLICCFAVLFVRDLIDNGGDYTLPLWLSIASYTIVSMAIGFWIAWAFL